MPKKNQKTKNDESAEQKLELPETASTEAEAVSTNSHQDNAVEDVSAEDLLDDVRRSLIEDEAQADEKKSSWWGKKGKGKSKDQVEEVAEPDATVVSGLADENKDTEYLEQIDELIEMLEPEVEAAKTELVVEPVVVPQVEPEVPVDVNELKKRAFSPSDGKEEQEISEVRAIALEGGEEVFVEVESKKEDTFDDRLKAFENALRPYRRYIYFVLAFLGVLVAVFVSVTMYTVYQRSLPPEPVKDTSNLPFPKFMSLPGGVNFTLGKGAIKDGNWNPRGPEWLEGTEICRWVAIPWSRQLEAVVRTLTKKDTIELTMSNNDKLTYNVYSIKEMTLTEMQALDSNSPCLLLVLAEQDSEKRWVVTALP